MKIIISFLLTFMIGVGYSQNVGIGTPTPSEKLDVNGNVNVQGQLKLAGDGGSTGQVLMKGTGNLPIWASLDNQFDTLFVLDNFGASDITANWTIPAGVSRIFVELWGGGGGGGYVFSGAAGGYVCGFVNTSAGGSVALTVGGGGSHAMAATPAVDGGTTGVIFSGQFYTAYGGGGSPAGITPAVLLPTGGIFTSSGTTTFGMYGEGGHGTTYNYGVMSTTTYFEEVHYGKGGDSPLYPGSGPAGGYSMVTRPANTSINQYYGQQRGMYPGYGGSSDFTYGYQGGGGRIIIRWKK